MPEEGYEAVVKLLVKQDDVNLLTRRTKGTTEHRYRGQQEGGRDESAVNMLMERDDADANPKTTRTGGWFVGDTE